MKIELIVFVQNFFKLQCLLNCFVVVLTTEDISVAGIVN